MNQIENATPAVTFDVSDAIDVSGTSLMGYIDTGYDHLVRTFGEPSRFDGYKVDAHWTIRFADGTVATIYDYKTGVNYNGDEGIPAEFNRDWHVGGFRQIALDRVREALGL